MLSLSRYKIYPTAKKIVTGVLSTIRTRALGSLNHSPSVVQRGLYRWPVRHRLRGRECRSGAQRRADVPLVTSYLHWASQFAAVGVIGAGGGAAAAIATAGLLGTRNALYGLQMAPRLQLRGWRRVLAAHWTIDESTNVGIAQEPLGTSVVVAGFWLTGGGVYLFWNLFTLAGALGAKSIGSPSAWGLDAAVPAAFLGLLWPRLTSRSTRVIATSAVVFSLIATTALPLGTAIIASAIVAVIAGWRDPR